jgi:hypothetical protein
VTSVGASASMVTGTWANAQSKHRQSFWVVGWGCDIQQELTCRQRMLQNILILAD